MRRNIIIKALVLGAIGCAFSAIGFAADVQNGHGQGITDSTTEVNGAKHEAVRSSWMDRTDIIVGTQSKVGAQVSVETLQPLTHYDENSKSVLFVQGGIGKGGQEDQASYFSGGNGGYWYPYNPVTKKGEQRYRPEEHHNTKSLGTVANVGLGYRILSKHEHAYVGVNTFYDHSFSKKYNRISGGLEYVSGFNEVRANIYKGLNSTKSEPYNVPLYEGYFEFLLDGGPAGYTVYKSQKALSGYDVSYARTFKNARWARAYVGAYHWNGLGATTHGEGPALTLNVGKSHGWQAGTTLQLTPHVSLDVGYTSDNNNSSGAYGFVKYTLGTSKFAWHGGKHSDDTITNARARMLDKVDRSPMRVGNTYEEFWMVVPYDHL